jgi:hypothetical protein
MLCAMNNLRLWGDYAIECMLCMFKSLGSMSSTLIRNTYFLHIILKFCTVKKWKILNNLLFKFLRIYWITLPDICYEVINGNFILVKIIWQNAFQSWRWMFHFESSNEKASMRKWINFKNQVPINLVSQCPIHFLNFFFLQQWHNRNMLGSMESLSDQSIYCTHVKSTCYSSGKYYWH